MILIANDGDKTVATIAARNALKRRFDGMQVTVLDAIGDVNVGGGRAGYIWSATLNDWQLTWKSSNANMSFHSESHVIKAGAVNTDYLPQDGIVWGCRIVDGDGLIVAEVKPKVTGTLVEVGTTDYDGLNLELTYGFGAAAGSPVIKPNPKYSIGSTGPNGGLVFYVDGSNEHGLEVTRFAGWVSEWNTAMTGAQKIALTSPSDYLWRLPTKTELGLLYDQRLKVGFPNSESYWSATERDSNFAWVLDFATGSQSASPKYWPMTWCAVHSF